MEKLTEEDIKYINEPFNGRDFNYIKYINEPFNGRDFNYIKKIKNAESTNGKYGSGDISKMVEIK